MANLRQSEKKKAFIYFSQQSYVMDILQSQLRKVGADSERLSDLPKVTQQRSGRAGIWTWTTLTPGP